MKRQHFANKEEEISNQYMSANGDNGKWVYISIQTLIGISAIYFAFFYMPKQK
tara:strand:- start:1131 stop:1289 length:159 start_codon:yes stop_codon:yes gene_type:complete